MTPPRRMPPYRIRTDRLELRSLEPADAPALRDLTAANREHLAPWMPWAHDLPQPRALVRRRLERLRTEFDRGRDFNFGVFEGEGGPLIGGLGVHPRRGPRELEIGYWIDHRRTRRGFATEAAGAATRAGVEILRATRIEIHVHPQNVVSARIPEHLGFRNEGVMRGRLRWHDGTWKDQVFWTLTADDLDESPAARIEYEAFDRAGRPLAPLRSSRA